MRNMVNSGYVLSEKLICVMRHLLAKRSRNMRGSVGRCQTWPGNNQKRRCRRKTYHSLYPKDQIMTHKQTATQNFLIIMAEVISQGLVKNKTEFAKRVGEHQQNITKMEAGTRSPTIDQLAAVCKLWGYNMNWIVMNASPKKIDPKMNVPIEQRVSVLEQQVRVLKKRLPS